MLKKLNLKIVISIAVTLLLATIFLFACDSHERLHDLTQYITNLKQHKVLPPKNNLSFRMKLPVPIVYQGQSKRAPFNEKVLASNEKSLIISPLHAYSLNMLRFIGTLSQHQKTFAFILAPDNKIYQVKVGDLIGDRYGKIINIQSDRIDISETTNEYIKRNTQRIVTLRLKDESE